MRSRKTKAQNWTIQNLNGDILHTGTESEIRKKFQSLLLQPGARKMFDGKGKEVAKIFLFVKEIGFE